MAKPRTDNKLSIERLREVIAYDPETGILTRIAQDAGNKGKEEIGEPITRWQIMVDGVGNSRHRVAWALYYNEWPVQSILTKDRDDKNLRISNLRMSPTFKTERQYKNHHRDRIRTDPVFRNKYMMKIYGITLDRYNQMLVEQDGKCAICGCIETEKLYGRVRPLTVDHNHTTGAVRGLLCSSCNKSLGGFKDNIRMLVKAVEYLSEHNQDQNPRPGRWHMDYMPSAAEIALDRTDARNWN